MNLVGYIILFTLIGSVFSLLGGVFLLLRPFAVRKITHFLTAFAAGALLGGAFFDLLPEAIHEGNVDPHVVFQFGLLGFLIFFLIERFLHWFHWHDNNGANHGEKHPVISLLIVGDSVHNFIDGVAIAAAFFVDIPLGITTAMAVAAHEIPQEIGDFAIMLKHGMKPLRVLLINLVSALFSLTGAIMIMLIGSQIQNALPYLLAITAGFFIYVAASDLIPEIHHEKRKGFAVYETTFLLLGTFVIFILTQFFEH